MKYILWLLIVGLFVSCSGNKQESTTPVSFAQTLKLQSSKIVVIDQNGDTLIISGKDTTIKYSYPIYTPHDTTVSYTYPVYDTTWRRKGNTQPPIPPDTTTPPPPSDFKLIYSNDFDAGTQLSSNQCGRCAISQTVKKSGTGSVRFEYRAGDPQISGGWRSEQQYPGSYSPSNRDIIVEYDELFENIGADGLSMQWHGGTSGTSGQMSLWIGGKRFRVQYNTIGTAGSPNNYSPYLGNININQWYHLKWEVRFSTGSDGYIRFYVDGSKLWEMSGKNCDGSGQYPKIGLNMFYSGTPTTILYFDNLRMYLK